MNFETFLEDYSWFDKTKPVGTHYLNPTKRSPEYVRPDHLTSADKHFFGDAFEDAADSAPSLTKDLNDYKGAYKASDDLLKLVSGTSLNREYVVYRAFGGKIEVTGLKPGSFIPQSGRQISTSLEWKISSDFSGAKSYHTDDGIEHLWMTRLRLPRNTKGFYLDIIENHNDHEEEFLLPSNTKIKVDGFSYVNVKSNFVLHLIDCVASQ